MGQRRARAASARDRWGSSGRCLRLVRHRALYTPAAWPLLCGAKGCVRLCRSRHQMPVSRHALWLWGPHFADETAASSRSKGTQGTQPAGRRVREAHTTRRLRVSGHHRKTDLPKQRGHSVRLRQRRDRRGSSEALDGKAAAARPTRPTASPLHRDDGEAAFAADPPLGSRARAVDPHDRRSVRGLLGEHGEAAEYSRR